MMKRLLPILLLATSLHAEGGAHKLYRWSVAALAAGNAADALSTLGTTELNPILGRGNFGRQQILIKTGIIGGGVLFERFIMRRCPVSEPAWVVGNFAGAAVLGGVAAHNWRQK